MGTGPWVTTDATGGRDSVFRACRWRRDGTVFNGPRRLHGAVGVEMRVASVEHRGIERVDRRRIVPHREVSGNGRRTVTTTNGRMQDGGETARSGSTKRYAPIGESVTSETSARDVWNRSPISRVEGRDPSGGVPADGAARSRNGKISPYGARGIRGVDRQKPPGSRRGNSSPARRGIPAVFPSDPMPRAARLRVALASAVIGPPIPCGAPDAMRGRAMGRGCGRRWG